MSEVIWRPTPEQIEIANVTQFMRRLGCATREEFLRVSVDHLEQFWDAVSKEVGIDWFTPYRQVLDTSRGVEWSQWFTGGKLNIAHNCLDRHLDERGGHPAIVWEGEGGHVRTLTFGQLAYDVNRLANGLALLGLRQGDRVAMVMPMIPEVVTILYACCKLGLIAVPIFSGYGEGAIASRLQDCGARVVITADAIYRRGKLLPLKEKIDDALQHAPSVERVIVFRYASQPGAFDGRRDVFWDDLIQHQRGECASLPLDSESPALILYTSGTTGRPKGTIHTHAGSLIQMAKEIHLAFDHKPEDRFFWLSDIGWMMGAWEIIGNHHFGGTILLYDGAPDYPEPDRLWRMLARHRMTVFGVSPTAIRLLMRKGADLPARHDLSALRLLGSTGEPWDETSYRWFFEHVGGGRCPIINISGGTEIVGCFLLPMPTQVLTPCTLGAPAPGMAVDVVDEHGQPVRGRTGYLVCTRPAPSMTRGLWGDPERYLETYWSQFPGMWFHGDWASVDEDGFWYLHGRSDESMKVAGRKVGPAEVEEALIEYPAISEAAVIGVPDELTGEAIVAFVVGKPGMEVDLKAAAAAVARSLGPTLRPKAIHLVKELPKTQSGKVVRRLIRQKYLGLALGDVSTVDNPAALDAFREPAG